MIIALDNKEDETAKKILEVSLASYRVESVLLGLESFPPLKETMADIRNSDAHFMGFLWDDALCGILEYEGHEPVTINRLVVHPENFRQGIATKLLHHLFSTGPIFKVTTASLNHPALKLYQQAGFKKCGSIVVEGGLELTELIYRI